MEQDYCPTCNQATPAIVNIFNIDELRLFLSSHESISRSFFWESFEDGENVDIAGLPNGASVVMVDNTREFISDSYGYSEYGTGHVVFTIRQGIVEKTYKIPGSYTSYNGWDWDYDELTEVRAIPKTVFLWEEV
jgi:hypothetical protein